MLAENTGCGSTQNVIRQHIPIHIPGTVYSCTESKAETYYILAENTGCSSTQNVIQQHKPIHTPGAVYSGTEEGAQHKCGLRESVNSKNKCTSYIFMAEAPVCVRGKTIPVALLYEPTYSMAIVAMRTGTCI